ncbi:Alpha/Beta hydrolase protein [Xylaria bambusicola]|uniref:Alpha/Beta hydrolase protein n=1 Tax=Xylaria bambusicola TaxID=326684 RepID=UPI0020083B0E|nr:Alpha/Beta hydrolase protein [Xylaria bambusicola]KAI0505533.1 Alpha/Beta hydrolase protein [Xylaria bambusicola]
MGDAVNVDAQVSASPSPDNLVANTAVEFAKQSEKLSLEKPSGSDNPTSAAVRAQFVTPADAVIVTEDGNRLPGVPLPEAHKLNYLRDELRKEIENQAADNDKEEKPASRTQRDDAGLTTELLSKLPSHEDGVVSQEATHDLHDSMPPSHTNPLFPPLPLYGPPSILRDLQCWTFRFSSFFLSAAFLGVIVLGALFTSIPKACNRIWLRFTFRNPDTSRPLYEEETRRNSTRQEQERLWKRRISISRGNDGQECPLSNDGFVPTEGGPDPIVCDVGVCIKTCCASSKTCYYARRVGLDVESFEVQTEDGFIIDLWHVYDPREYTERDVADRSYRGPDPFTGQSRKRLKDPAQKRKFPVLLMHGLLQSAGAYCVNDDDSLAFYLCKSGYDVWLGNNRCGFNPKHVLLDYSDPRMWCWNIRQMGIFDLSALTSRVIRETSFSKIGLIAHSQGTTETFVALAKEQRPELGEKLTVFCALAPAAYAGPLIGKMYFKFMRVISPALFRLMFGIHAFIPLMMVMHSMLDPRIYGWLGYKVFSFLFDWTDARWDRALKNRMFQFAPVYVSSESMRWWLGRECFAKHKCILLTKDQWRSEEREDIEGETDGPLGHLHDSNTLQKRPAVSRKSADPTKRKPKGSTAWYNEQAPPFALWVAGNDNLVDGEKLLRRFERGREPHVKVVHSKVIPDYEHLDVIWAMDVISQVFEEVREVLWKTCDARDQCRVPTGCESVSAWAPSETKIDEAEQSSSDSP